MASSRSMQTAIEFILLRWQQGLTLKEIAALHGVDPGNLARAFRARRGISPKKHINSQRRLFILSRLSNGKPFGFEIGTNLGFKTDRAFYRWVRNEFGVSWRTVRNGNDG